MKKKLSALLIVIIMAVSFLPLTSRAAITPYFVLINETLLPFSEETMPFISGGEIFIPVSVLSGLRVWEVGSDDTERVRLYRGNMYVDFFTRPGHTRTVDHRDVVLGWPPARRMGRRFYVPLRQVSEFFGFTFQELDISPDIIPERQMRALRIISDSTINGPTAIGMNRAAIRNAYLEHFAPPILPPPPQIPGETPSPPQGDEIAVPPTFEDVTIHLSFRDVSAGSAEWILDLLDIQTASGFHACFFVNADDIFEDPGLIRRIAGTGHSIGIWLREGTYEEYLQISALLFEAAKIRTLLVSADENSEAAIETAQRHDLIFWAGRSSLIDYTNATMAAITSLFPRESGSRKNLFFTCSEEADSIMPGVYSYLRANLFTVERITETTQPIIMEDER